MAHAGDDPSLDDGEIPLLRRNLASGLGNDMSIFINRGHRMGYAVNLIR